MSPRHREVKAAARRAVRGRTRGGDRAAGMDEAAIDAGQPVEEVGALELLQPESLVSANFRLRDLTRSEIARRQGIDNRLPDQRTLRAVSHLARRVLEPVRQKYGMVMLNSAYRSQALERALKNRPSNWISMSQHTLGEACDIEVVGVSTLDLARWIAGNLDFDQLICECYDPREGVNSGWVHVSLKCPHPGESERKNRGEQLSHVADRQGRWVFVAGLVGEVS